MVKKPTYGGLEQRVKTIEKVATSHEQVEDLKEICARYKALFEHSHDFIFTHDLQGNFIDANQAALDFLGYTKEEITSLNFASLLRKDQIPKAVNAVEKILEVGFQKDMCEYRLKRKDGGYVYIETEAHLLHHDGKPFAIQGIARDITERKQAEEMLKKSEESYRTLAENVADVIYTADMQFRFTYISPSIVTLTGYIAEEVNGLSVLDMMPPTSREKTERVLKEELARVKKRGRNPSRFKAIEVELICKDGSTICTESNVKFRYDSRGHAVGFLGVIRDITERKQAEEALKESEEKFRIFMETASDLMHIEDKNDNFTYVNESMARTLGYSKEEMIGMHITKVLSKGKKGKVFKSELKELVTTGEITMETVWVTKDGKEIRGELKVVASYDSDGKYAGSKGVLRDITKHKQAIEVLRKRERELEINAKNLEELNTALKVLLRRREEDKIELEEKVLSNMRNLVVPYLGKLKKSGLDNTQEIYLDILKSNLSEIILPFSRSLSSKFINLTHTEIQVANLVRQGKSTKEIAGLMNSSPRTIESHRESIRKKLNIKNIRTNLRSYLSSIE